MKKIPDTDFAAWELDFFEKLDNFLSKFSSTQKAAEALDFSVDTLKSYIYRLRHPKYATIEKLMQRMGYQALPAETSIQRLGTYSPVEKVVGDNLPTVPVHLAAGAGQPIDIWNAEPSQNIPVLPRYYHKNIAAVEVLGDSMEPTIKKGAFVGVVPISGDLKEGDVYLVRRPPFGLLVKRVRMNEKGELVLVSDNPAYPPQVVPFDGYNDIIIGHVVWCWQNM